VAGFAARFAAARAAGFDHIAQDALNISDTPIDGLIASIKETKDGTFKEVRREDMIQHRKLQIDTRLKLLAKWDPKRYGERLRGEDDPEDKDNSIKVIGGLPED
jgi:hypothetical protein